MEESLNGIPVDELGHVQPRNRKDSRRVRNKAYIKKDYRNSQRADSKTQDGITPGVVPVNYICAPE
jgi:hypothetical protein